MVSKAIFDAASNESRPRAMQTKNRKLATWTPKMPDKLERKPKRVACATQQNTVGPGVSETRDHAAK